MFVKGNDNWKAKRHFGPPQTQKVICERGRQEEELRSWRRRNNFHKKSAKLLYLEGELHSISQKQWSFWVYTTFCF
jgi:hypothetical protein